MESKTGEYHVHAEKVDLVLDECFAGSVSRSVPALQQIEEYEAVDLINEVLRTPQGRCRLKVASRLRHGILQLVLEWIGVKSL